MPVPTVVTDLSTTIASNSPAATDSPGEGDDHIRALAAFIAQSYAGTLTSTFKVNASGVPYGTAIHNPGGTLTGTTNQLICSGTYTPTLTNQANIDSSSANANWTWIRVGNVVTVAGVVSINPTAATTATTLYISLPIASGFTATTHLAGQAARIVNSASSPIGYIYAESTSDVAQLNYYNDSVTTSDSWAVQFQYLIL